MVKYRYRSSAAYLRSVCPGGETHAQAVTALKRLPRGSAPVPAAEDAQARLEAYFWSAVCWPDDYFAHPFGIRRVHPKPDGLVVELDGGHVLTRPLVYRLLPRISEEHGLGTLLPARWSAAHLPALTATQLAEVKSATSVGVAPVAPGTPAPVAASITEVVHSTFISGMTAAFLTAAVVALGGALIALLTKKGENSAEGVHAGI